ncbi:class I SAM-dependent methyltransferase [Roseicyclus elongatus]|nr:class I SAM-dependent methyltransferase [Roseibacterium elongatum]
MQRLDGTSFSSPQAFAEASDGQERLITTLHPKDNMLPAGQEGLYYWMGRTALDCIKAVAPDRDFDRILDLPSGYGRVMRHLRAEYPNAAIVACDIDTDAIAFCAETFGARPVPSFADISRTDIDGTFDLIWVGSLFTHLDAASADALFKLLHDKTAAGGLLAFSIAGRFVYERAVEGELGGLQPATFAEMRVQFEKDGFTFGSYRPGIVDEANYGRAFIAEEWLEAKRRELGGFDPLAYIDRGYARRQDVVIWEKA